jgi:WD40 repeat protein
MAGGEEVVVGTSIGDVYRVLALDAGLANLLVESAHTAPISCVAFGARSDQFACGSSDGELRLWDLGDYGCASALKIKDAGGILCLAWQQQEAIIAGCADGSIHAYDVPGLSRRLWFIHSAHRGGVNSIALKFDISMSYLVSGGADATVRIWSLHTRECVMQFTEHSKAVATVLVDVQYPQLVHSVSHDCMVITFDIQR